MKSKQRKRLSRILIIIGALILLTFAVYEGMTYPWQLLFSGWGMGEISDELPDPAPLPDSARLVPLEENTPAPAPETVGSVAEQPNFFAARPPMDITKLGVIKIPKIQISENIVEGTGEEMLYGVGHLRSSPMPGEPGNCVLSGHRNYIVMRPFRYLDKMEVGDKVYITYNEQNLTFEVFNIFEVEPDASWVLQPQEGETHMITLITCTPVLTYTRRMIVQARLVP